MKDVNKKVSTPFSIERISILQDVESIPEQTLKDTSWVLIYSNTDDREAKVFVFNNDEMPEDYQYASFKEWAELSIDDLVETEQLKLGGRYDQDIIVEKMNFSLDSEGKEEGDGWSRLSTRDGYSCQVVHVYNGGINQENLEKKVAICNQSCGNVISDYCDDRAYEAELQRERLFRP